MRLRWFLYGVAVLLLVCGAAIAVHVANSFPTPGVASVAPTNSDARTVSIGGQTIHAWVADTPELRQLGLGGRDSLAADEGMLFVFPQEGIYPFWMKDMHFSIDIIWISSDLHVVDMWQGASPGSFPHAYTPKNNAQYVLEVANGFATRNNVRIGDLVSL